MLPAKANPYNRNAPLHAQSFLCKNPIPHMTNPMLERGVTIQKGEVRTSAFKEASASMAKIISAPKTTLNKPKIVT
jgi:hypothetical protein